MGFDTSIRWSYFKKRLQREFRKESRPSGNLLRQPRTEIRSGIRNFFAPSSVPRSGGQGGRRRAGDQKDDERLMERVVSDIEKQNVTTAIVITHDIERLDLIADKIGEGNLVRIDPIEDNRILVLLRSVLCEQVSRKALKALR